MNEHDTASTTSKSPEFRKELAEADARAYDVARLNRVTFALFVVFWVAWMAMLVFIRIRHPGLDHGDVMPDANVLNAGRNFDKHGLGYHYGVPKWDTYEDPSRPPYLYAHYPPLAYWIHQGLKAAGLHTMVQWRVVSLCMAGVASLLVLLFMSILTRNLLVGVLATFFYMFSIPFAEFADSLNMHTYMQLMLFGCLTAWLVFEWADTVRGRVFWLLVSALCFFVDCWLTFEHILLIGAYTGGRMLWFRKKRIIFGWLVIFFVPVLVMSMRVVHNGMALGGIRNAISDLRGAAKYRAGFEESQSISLADLCNCWIQRLGLPGLPPESDQAEFEYPLLRRKVAYPAILLGMVMLCTWHLREMQGVRIGLGNAVWLLLSGVIWFIVMKEGTFRHRHNIMVLLPALSLLLGSLAAGGILQRALQWPRRAPIRYVGPLLGLVLLGGFAYRMKDSRVINQVLSINGPLQERITYLRDWQSNIAAAGAAMTDVQRVVFTNRWREPAALVNRPFQLLEQDAVPKDLGPNDAFWLESWTPQEREMAFEALDRYGFPDLLSPPAIWSFVYRGRGQQALPLSVSFDDRHRITAIRMVLALDGASRTVQLLVEGGFDETSAKQTIVTIRALDGKGEQLAAWETRVAWNLWNDKRAWIRGFLPIEKVLNATRYEITVWSDAAKGKLTFKADKGPLPAGMEIGPDQKSLRWSAERLGTKAPSNATARPTRPAIRS